MRFIEFNTREYKEILNDIDQARLYRDGLNIIWEKLLDYSLVKNSPDLIKNIKEYPEGFWDEGLLRSIEDADPIGTVSKNIRMNMKTAQDILTIPDSKQREYEAEKFVDQVLVHFLDFSRCIPKEGV